MDQNSHCLDEPKMNYQKHWSSPSAVWSIFLSFGSLFWFYSPQPSAKLTIFFLSQYSYPCRFQQQQAAVLSEKVKKNLRYTTERQALYTSMKVALFRLPAQNFIVTHPHFIQTDLRKSGQKKNMWFLPLRSNPHLEVVWNVVQNWISTDAS